MADDIQPPKNNRVNSAVELITSGRLGQAVWYLAWPTIINTLILTAYNVINRVFVGRLPNASEALAAVGIGGTLLQIQFALVIGLSAGTAALVSRFLGAGRVEDADEAARQSLTLSGAAGMLTGAPFIVFGHEMARLIGARPSVIGPAGDYTAIIAWFSLPLFVYFVTITALRSAGEVRPSLYAGAAVIAINILLDWLLIFGIGPFPMLVLRGAAIATGVSRVAGTAIGFYFLRRSPLSGALSHLRPHWGWFGRILNIGWPASVQNLLWTTAYLGFVWILGRLPANEVTLAQAAVTVSITIESLAFMPGVAYSTAATPLVGQNLGAGKPERAEHSAWIATWHAVGIMSAVAVLFLAVPGALARIFTNDRALIPLIVAYLRINAISEPLQAVSMVLRGALQGAGDTRTPAWITALTNWILRLPTTYLLAVTFGMGATGAWIAMSATTFLSGILMATYFKRGAWRETQV